MTLAFPRGIYAPLIAVPVLADSYGVCAANLGEPSQNAAQPPFHIQGCVRITVRAGEQQIADLLFGLGGLTFELREQGV